MSEPSRLLVVGSVNADFVISVERLPAEGETVGDGSFAQHWGGKGANQAVMAARSGARVVMLGAVGDDRLGAGAVEALQREGVETNLMAIDPEVSTGVALIMVDEQGRNLIAVAPGANSRIEAARVTEVCDSLGPGVILTCFEVPDPVVVAAVRAGVALGAHVVVNPAPARALPEALRGSGVILTPNEHEVRGLTGVDDPLGGATELSRWTCAPVVTTLGEVGAAICSAGQAPVHLPAPRVEAVDTTGAGDAFNGALAAALAEHGDLQLAAGRAVAAASASVLEVGARGAASNLDRDQVRPSSHARGS